MESILHEVFDSCDLDSETYTLEGRNGIKWQEEEWKSCNLVEYNRPTFSKLKMSLSVFLYQSLVKNIFLLNLQYEHAGVFVYWHVK